MSITLTVDSENVATMFAELRDLLAGGWPTKNWPSVAVPTEPVPPTADPVGADVAETPVEEPAPEQPRRTRGRPRKPGADTIIEGTATEVTLESVQAAQAPTPLEAAIAEQDAALRAQSAKNGDPFPPTDQVGAKDPAAQPPEPPKPLIDGRAQDAIEQERAKTVAKLSDEKAAWTVDDVRHMLRAICVAKTADAARDLFKEFGVSKAPEVKDIRKFVERAEAVRVS